MVSAMVLINAERGRINAVAESLNNMKGITEVYSVAGPYDLVAMIRVASNEQLADLVTTQMINTEGIVKTHTLLAFRTYSRYDLERMFSIGE